MKLFHTENGRDVVYVQMQDLMYLTHETDIDIPATIFQKVVTRGRIVNDANRFEFVKFEEEHELKFFRSLEFIIDFDQYKGFTDKQLEDETRKIAAKVNEIAKKWNNMTAEERRKNGVLYKEYNNLNYMISFLTEIYAVKYGHRCMPFPEFVEIP